MTSTRILTRRRLGTLGAPHAPVRVRQRRARSFVQVASIAGGAVIIEWIFGIPGMGQFLVDAIVQRDYPVIQGINLIIVLIIVLTNLTVDLVYAVLDPRIRY